MTTPSTLELADELVKNVFECVVPVLGSGSVAVSFEPLSEEWRSNGGAPNSVNAFLFDVRINSDAMASGRDYDRASSAWVRPPRVIDVRYLVTVWTQIPAQEHVVLGQIVDHLIEPVNFAAPPHWLAEQVDAALPDSWDDHGGPLPIISLDLDSKFNPADLWSSLGKAKATVELCVTIPVLDHPQRSAEPVTNAGISIHDLDGSTGDEGGAVQRISDSTSLVGSAEGWQRQAQETAPPDLSVETSKRRKRTRSTGSH